MAELTDSELRKLLESYGEDVGPINDSTRSLWEKRLLKLKSSRIPRKVEKVLYPKTSTSDIYISTVFDSHCVGNSTFNRNDEEALYPKTSTSDIDIPSQFRSYQMMKGAFNRHDPVNRIKMSSPNPSEESCSSCDLDYSLVTGEPGNSPYPLRAKPKTTSLEKSRDRRMLEIESPNYEMYRNFESYRNFEKYCELRDKGKITYPFTTVDGKKQVCEKETTCKELAADSGEDWSDNDEDYFLAENLVKTKRGTLETIGRFLGYLIKGVLLIIILSLCLDTEYFKSVARGRF